MVGLTITERFFLEFIRPDNDDSLRDAIRELGDKKNEIDWTGIAQHGHKIAPYIFFTINRLGLDLAVPRDISLITKFNYLYFQEKNKKNIQALAEIGKKFKEEGIDLLFIKGAALIFTVYSDDKGLRYMDDIDVLVRHEDLAKAEKILQDIGYVEGYERLSKEHQTRFTKEFFSRHHFHYVYFKDQVRLELHWNVAKVNNKAFLDKLFRSSHPITLHGSEVKITNAEASVLMACLNFSKDFYESFVRKGIESEADHKEAFYYAIFFFCELKEILRYYHNDISWKDFLYCVKSIKREYEIFTLLLLADKIAKAPIPAFVLRKAQSSFFSFIFGLFSRNLKYTNFRELFELKEKIFRFRKRLYHLPRMPGIFLRKIFVLITGIYGLILKFLSNHFPSGAIFLKKIVGFFKRLFGN
ncbi:MAG: nucleotidyltransferase family protein [Candidatus Omnitrophica bacterium]|nr:nucleotidyltransferase family protein [Candidatus Omnitrophota bacterium]